MKPAPITIQALDWAYKDTASAPIVAGDTGAGENAGAGYRRSRAAGGGWSRAARMAPAPDRMKDLASAAFGYPL
jgi:hypothetical protein